MVDLPSGTVTFLFTDIEGSTRLFQRFGDRYAGLLAEHQALIRSAIDDHRGVEVSTEGDSFFVAFASASDAVATAVACQRSLQTHQWPHGGEVRVRAGLHTGDAQPLAGSYVSLAVHQAARVAAAAHGGQVLLSDATRQLVLDELGPDVGLIELGAYRLKDFDQPVRLYQLAHHDLRGSFPALRCMVVEAHNLPGSLSTFVGRHDELANLPSLVERHRLVTFVGVGGVGKSRMALEVGRQLLPAFTDGVWWVDLAALTDPALIPKAVADALSITEVPNQPVFDTLIRETEDRQLLLILDNCERLVEACAAHVHRFLTNTQSISVLATSREPLGIAGEAVVRVPSLSFPPTAIDQATTVASLKQYESASLFLDRAALADSEFRPSDADAEHIARICHRLDGLPLAIELAAARSRVLPMEKIADGLDDVLHLLSGGSRAAAERQRTIEASIRWSHELLLPREQHLFRRLGVFAGGFSLEAVEAICADNANTDATFHHFTELVNKSLVQLDDDPGLGRYRLLEPIRQYAVRRLVASREQEELRLRHLKYLIGLAERAQPRLESEHNEVQVRSLDWDRDNLRAALDCALEYGESEAGLRICSALWQYWEARGVDEGLGWLRRLLALPCADMDIRAYGLTVAGLLCLTAGDPFTSLQYAQQALTAAFASSDRRLIARANMLSGWSRVFVDRASSRPYFEVALPIAQEEGDASLTADALAGLGFLELSQGHLFQARELLERAVASAHTAGTPGLIARCFLFLGWALLEQTELAAARDALTNANRAALSARAPFWENFSSSLLAFGGLLEGSLNDPKRELDSCLARARELNSGFGIAIALWCAGQAAAGEGDPSTARFLTEGAALQALVGLRWFEASGLARLVEFEMSDSVQDALRHIDEAEAAVVAAPNVIAEGRVALARAVMAMDSDRLAAWRSFHSAISLFHTAGHIQGVVDATERLASLLAEFNQEDDGARLLGAARALRRARGYQEFPVLQSMNRETERHCRAALGDERYQQLLRHGEGETVNGISQRLPTLRPQ